MGPMPVIFANSGVAISAALTDFNSGISAPGVLLLVLLFDVDCVAVDGCVVADDD